MNWGGAWRQRLRGIWQENAGSRETRWRTFAVIQVKDEILALFVTVP